MIKSLYNVIFKEKSDLKNEKDFLIHQKKYDNVMQELTQTNDQKNNFYRVTINNSFLKKETNSSEIIENITIPSKSVEFNREVCAAFVERAMKLNKKIVIKNFDQKITSFKTEMNSINPLGFSEIAKTKNVFQKIPLRDNPHFQESLYALSSSLEKASAPIISMLLSYSNCSELLTFMSMSQMMSLLMGFKIFSKVYYSFLEPGSLSLYLKSLKLLWLDPNSSLPFKILEITKPIRPYLIPIICTAIGGYANHLYNDYITPSMSRVITDVEKYIPNEFVRDVFKKANDFSQASFFGIGRTIGNARDSFVEGLFGKHFSFIKKIVENVEKLKED